MSAEARHLEAKWLLEPNGYGIFCVSVGMYSEYQLEGILGITQLEGFLRIMGYSFWECWGGYCGEYQDRYSEVFLYFPYTYRNSRIGILGNTGIRVLSIGW